MNTVTVTVAETTLTEVIIPKDKLGQGALGIYLKNAGAAALTELNTYLKIGDGPYFKAYNADANYTGAPNGPLYWTMEDGTWITMGAAKTVMMHWDVRALSAIKVTAKCGTTTTVDVASRRV